MPRIEVHTDYSHQDTAVSLAVQNVIGQFIYPTGTGKTLIQARTIAEHVAIKPGFGLYVVLAPRILLARQLFMDIHVELTQKRRQDCSYFSLHSGKAVDFKDALGHDIEDADDVDEIIDLSIMLREAGITQTSFSSGTSLAKVRDAVDRARVANVPLVICSTYHSMMILKGFAIDVLLSDEAHHLVSPEFSAGHTLTASKRFFFTASRRVTAGRAGLGMNNPVTFGPILDMLNGAQAVARKLIVRPRLHYVEIAQIIEEGAEHNADIVAIEKAFKKHQMMTGALAPKLLISCRGSQHLNLVLEQTDNFEKLRRVTPGLQVFSILSGKENVRIDGVLVTREEWFKRLRGLRDHESCLILHYDIISEGIDVPGITGIMPLRNLSSSKFLQTNGRSSRLHAIDREADVPVEGIDWVASYVKPYSWVIVPCYANLGDDIKSTIEDHVGHLRDFGWVPDEDVISTTAGGDAEPELVQDLVDRKRRLPKFMSDILNVSQRLEDQEATDLLVETLRKESYDQLRERLLGAA